MNLKKPQKQKQTKQTRTGSESQKWRSHGGLSAGRARKQGENWGKGPGNKKHKWEVQNRQGEAENNMGNGEAKELISRTHGHELRCGGMLVGERVQGRGNKGEKNMGQL